MRALAISVLLLCSCESGKAVAPPPAGPQLLTLEQKKAKLPKLAQLPCFECHPLAAYESGSRFPHLAETHVDLGHCHRCHRSGGHHGTTVDLAPCQECHDEIPNRAPPASAPDGGT